MARKIKITHSDGSETNYESTLTRGYHLKRGTDGVCVTEKRLFRKERIVACYRNADASEERCLPCEAINPIQRRDE